MRLKVCLLYFQESFCLSSAHPWAWLLHFEVMTQVLFILKGQFQSLLFAVCYFPKILSLMFSAFLKGLCHLNRVLIKYKLHFQSPQAFSSKQYFALLLILVLLSTFLVLPSAFFSQFELHSAFINIQSEAHQALF